MNIIRIGIDLAKQSGFKNQLQQLVFNSDLATAL